MESLLNNTNFQKILTQLAEKQGVTYNHVYEDAAGYLKELYTTHQPLANIFGVQGAQYILQRGYNKTIDVNPPELKKLTKFARRHPIAYVMTHKTYIDMMVLGVVLARHGLPIPYTFAGINMAFVGLGQFGRQSGVIFIRRSFKENQVYKATLRHFIASLVDQKAHFMWAIEGTRSRTGKLVWPKMGILKYIREAEQDSKHEVKYVPVSIVYDLIPDVEEMTKEGRGKKKAPESLAWFLNYIKKLGDNYGKISLRFGDPVDILPNQSDESFRTNGMVPAEDDGISKFALSLVHRINQITPVTTTSLICTALMSKFSMTKRGIESDLSNMMHLIESIKPDALVDRGKPIGESVQSGLKLLLKAELIQQHGKTLHAKYVINANQYLSTTYYSNMAVHHLYHQAFIELALVKIANLPAEDRMAAFWIEIMALRDLFKFEFFYSPKSIFTDEVEIHMQFVHPGLGQLIKDKQSDILSILKNQKVLVAPVVLNTYIEAYKVVIQTLQQRDAHRVFEENSFMDDCLFLGEELQWQGQIQRLESVSKPFLVNGLRLVKNLDLIPDASDYKKEKLIGVMNQLDDIAHRNRLLQSMILSQQDNLLPSVPIERDIVPGSKTESITKSIIDGESGAHIGAFFDLDRTLIKGFSAKEFFQARLMSGKITSSEVIAQFAGVLVYAMGNGNFAGLAAVSARGVKGIGEEIFVEMGEEVYQKYLVDEIYPESRALVAAHLAKGHTVAIISAATPYQVNPIARDLGIDNVMCTRMEVTNGKFTGEIVPPACWGDGKAYAARELTEQHNLDLSKSYFYTDSAEDLPLLEIVGKPRPMNPDQKLSALAFQNDWPVYRFNDEQRPFIPNLLRTSLALGSLIPAALNGLATGTFYGSRKDGVNSMMATVGDLVTTVAGIQLAVKGEEHLWSNRPCVFILNHQSNVDVFIACKLIRQDASGIAKKELKNMPIIGQMMTAGGAIFIDRQNKEKAIEAMQPAVDALKSGTSIIIFPEGTRSYSYKLGAFKKGAFHLAMQAKVPLVPIIIKNAHDAMPRGTSLFRPAVIEVKVGSPIQTKGWNKKNLDKYIFKVRKLFLDELGQIE